MKTFFRWVSKLPEVIFAIILVGFILLSLYFADRNTFVQNQFPGLLLDILVFGVLIVIFNKFADRRRDIKRWQEEIDDYRGWDEKEATFRIIGNIRRLNKQGFYAINLSDCFLEQGRLFHPNLSCAYMAGAKLQNAILFYANLQGAYLHHADLKGADLTCANLKKADLRFVRLSGANLQGADLSSANLDGALLKDTRLDAAILSGAELRNTQYITLNQLCRTKTLFQAKIECPLMRELQEKCPHLLEKPCDED